LIKGLNIGSKFRILIAVFLAVLMMELGVALFALYLIGPSVDPIVDFKTLVFLLVLNVSSFTFLISQLWNLPLRAKVVKLILFIYLVLILIFGLGYYAKDLLMQSQFPSDYLANFVFGAIHPFVWLSFILPTIGVFCGEYGLYFLFKRKRKQDR